MLRFPVLFYYLALTNLAARIMPLRQRFRGMFSMFSMNLTSPRKKTYRSSHYREETIQPVKLSKTNLPPTNIELPISFLMHHS